MVRGQDKILSLRLKLSIITSVRVQFISLYMYYLYRE